MPSILARTHKTYLKTRKPKKRIPGRRSKEALQAMRAKYGEALKIIKVGKQNLYYPSRAGLMAYRRKKGIDLERYRKFVEETDLASIKKLYERFEKEQILGRREAEEIMVKRSVSNICGLWKILGLRIPRNREELLSCIDDITHLKRLSFAREGMGLYDNVLEYLRKIIQENKKLVNYELEHYPL